MGVRDGRIDLWVLSEEDYDQVIPAENCAFLWFVNCPRRRRALLRSVADDLP